MSEAKALMLKIKQLLNTDPPPPVETLLDLCVQFGRLATTPAERAMAHELERARQEHMEQLAQVEAQLTEDLRQIADEEGVEWAEQAWLRDDEDDGGRDV